MRAVRSLSRRLRWARNLLENEDEGGPTKGGLRWRGGGGGGSGGSRGGAREGDSDGGRSADVSGCGTNGCSSF